VNLIVENGVGRATNKNPEVVLLPHLNRQFALDPCRPVVAGYFRTRRTILTWAPGLLPTGLGLNASGSYLAFDGFLVSSTGGSLLTVAIPLLPLRCRRGTVNQLQSRTRHQPENLGNCQRTSLFYSCHFRSQQNYRRSIAFVFNRVQLVHRRVTENCAVSECKL